MDRYQVTDRAVRDVLVYYLTERAAVLDHSSLVEESQLLVSLFWVDLERHHPGISSLGLPGEVAQQWKQRLRTLPNGQPRAYTHGVLLAVRGFYLDLLQWSLADPARWARWAAPCPITAADIRGYQKQPAEPRPGCRPAPAPCCRSCRSWSRPQNSSCNRAPSCSR